MKSKPLTLLFILTILAVLLPPTSTSANTSYKSLSVTSSSLPPIPKVELMSQFGGAVNTIAVQGDYAYAGIAKRLVVFDISDPANPTLAGQTELGPNIIKDIAIKGNYAYIVDEGSGTPNPTTGTFDWDGGLHIIDISDPAQPVAVKTYTISWYPHCIQIIGDYAYVTTNSALHIFYLNNPTDLVLKGKLNAYVTDSQVVVQDTTAYITNPSYDELYIVDVSNPVTPTKIGTYSMSNVGVVAVQGDYAHIARAGDYSSEVQIIDVSDPAHPTSAGSYDIGAPEYRYAESPQEITLRGNYAYVAGKVHGMHIVDISNPTAPIVVASPKIDGGANTVQLAGDHAYTAGNGGGLWVLNVSAPTTPTLSGAYHQVGGAETVTLDGQYAYSASGGLNIVDVSNPTQPQETAYRSESGGKVVISNDHAYQIISSQEDPPDAHMTISDISDPSNPQEIGQLDVAGYPRRNLAAAGNFVYVGIAFSGNAGEVRIVDVSDPTAPQERGSFPTSTDFSFGYPNDLAIRDDILYVCQPEFHIVDVSDPDNPIEIEHDLPILQPKYITLAGDYAYIATGTSGYYTGLWILNISDPVHPTTTGSSVINYYWLNPYGIAVSGNHVFIATENLGLKIFDISNPAQPAQVLMALSQHGDALRDVAAQGEYVYLADAEQGLIILRITPDVNAIYGHIWYQNNNFIGHPVQIAVGDSITTTTDAAGSYIVYDLPAGNYTVTPLTPGYIWVPKSHTATLPRSQPESLDFTAYNFYKEVNTGGIPTPRDGDILTYTLSLVYPTVPFSLANNLYDPIPEQTTYLTNSLSAPSGITYDPTLDAIIGTVPLTPNLTTQVSYAVRIVVTNTTGLPQPPITNQACLHDDENLPPTWCDLLSNEVTVGTWAVYLPLVLR